MGVACTRLCGGARSLQVHSESPVPTVHAQMSETRVGERVERPTHCRLHFAIHALARNPCSALTDARRRSAPSRSRSSRVLDLQSL